MELVFSLLTLAVLFWLHRRSLRRAYAAGWAAGLAEQNLRERHGLAELPAQEPHNLVSHEGANL